MVEYAHTAKRAARDAKTLTLQQNKDKTVIAGEQSARTPRFVKTSNGTKSLDEASLARARRLAGLKGYVSNIPATVMPPAEFPQLQPHPDPFGAELSNPSRGRR